MLAGANLLKIGCVKQQILYLFYRDHLHLWLVLVVLPGAGLSYCRVPKGGVFKGGGVTGEP